MTDLLFDNDQRTIAMTNALALPELFTEIEQATESIIPDAAEAMEGDVDGLLTLQFALLRAIGQLKKAYDNIEERVLPIMPDVTMVEGVTDDDGRELEIVRQKGGSSQAWQHNLLWPEVTRAIVDRHPEIFHNPDSGELRDPDEVATLFVEQLRTCVTPSWKKGDQQRKTKGLRDLGINPSRFSTYKEGKSKVAFIPQAKEE